MKACIFNIQKFSLHDGPGIRTVVFFKGCPLRCAWCSNPESQKLKPEKMWDVIKKDHITVGQYKTIEDIMNEVTKDMDFYEESGGGVTLSGGEILAQAEFAIKLLKTLKEHGIHTTCETTGFAKPYIFNELANQIDLLFFDIKHYDNTKHLEGTGVSNEIILKNLATVAKTHPDLTVRIPVIPTYNDTLEDARNFAILLNELSVCQVELLPFHQFGEKKYEYLDKNYKFLNLPQLHREDLIDYQKIIEKQNINCLLK